MNLLSILLAYLSMFGYMVNLKAALFEYIVHPFTRETEYGINRYGRSS